MVWTPRLVRIINSFQFHNGNEVGRRTVAFSLALAFAHEVEEYLTAPDRRDILSAPAQGWMVAAGQREMLAMRHSIANGIAHGSGLIRPVLFRRQWAMNCPLFRPIRRRTWPGTPHALPGSTSGTAPRCQRTS